MCVVNCLCARGKDVSDDDDDEIDGPPWTTVEMKRKDMYGCGLFLWSVSDKCYEDDGAHSYWFWEYDEDCNRVRFSHFDQAFGRDLTRFASFIGTPLVIVGVSIRSMGPRFQNYGVIIFNSKKLRKQFRCPAWIGDRVTDHYEVQQGTMTFETRSICRVGAWSFARYCERNYHGLRLNGATERERYHSTHCMCLVGCFCLLFHPRAYQVESPGVVTTASFDLIARGCVQWLVFLFYLCVCVCRGCGVQMASFDVKKALPSQLSSRLLNSGVLMNEMLAPRKKKFSFLEQRVAAPKHVPNANAEEKEEQNDVADANNKKKPTALVWVFLCVGIPLGLNSLPYLARRSWASILQAKSGRKRCNKDESPENELFLCGNHHK